jgi:hypothetical protein
MRHRFLAVLTLIAGLGSIADTASAQAFPPQIPYATIEPLIRNFIASQVPSRVSGHESCATIFCPDADWRVDLSTAFRFTSTPQPRIVPRGPSPWIDGFDIELDAQAEVTLNANAYIEIGGPASDIDPPNWPLTKRVGIHFEASVFTEPAVEVDPDSINIWLTDDGGNINVDGLNGDLTVLGIEVGVIAGFVLLDPITGGILGAILGNVAAEAAEKKIRSEIEKRVSQVLADASREMNEELRARIIPELPRINDALAVLISLITGMPTS